MEYTAFYKAKSNPERNFEISYCVMKIDNSFCIESSVDGGTFSEISYIGNCKEEYAEKLAELFAEKGVHPVHIEDIISDMVF